MQVSRDIGGPGRRQRGPGRHGHAAQSRARRGHGPGARRAGVARAAAHRHPCRRRRALAAAEAAVDAALAARERSTGSAAADSAAHDRRRASTTCRRTPRPWRSSSVPGAYAVAEAADAIAAGRSVLVFSDGVPVEHEVALKDAAHAPASWSWAPTAARRSSPGVALGFANVVRAGPGRPGRRLRHRRPAGLLPARHGRRRASRTCSASAAATSPRRSAACATLDALAALDADPATERVLLVSKPPGAVGRGIRVRPRRPNSRCRCAPPSSRPRRPT